MLRISCLVLVFIVAVTTTHSDETDKIPMTVYYESECSDSRDFIIKQLQPNFEMLEDCFELDFVPFGKAYSIDGEYFECQHGPTECFGNMVQACTLELMKNEDYTTQEMIDYVACAMQHPEGANGTYPCASSVGVDEDDVDECVNSDQGRRLLLRHERFTNRVKPKFIPTVTFDRTFDQEIQDAAMINLPGTMCDIARLFYEINDKPSSCENLCNERAKRESS